MNLSGRDDALFIIRQHFVDSLSCVLSSVIGPQSHLLDIGTGAGFPAIPLKIYYPSLQVVAVDAVAKKVMFLRHLCRMLELQDVGCLASRIVPLSSSFRKNVSQRSQDSVLQTERFNVVVSRAVGTVPYLVELAQTFLGAGGHILLQRGKHGKRELAQYASFLQEIAVHVVDIIEVNFSFAEYPRYLMVLRMKGVPLSENKA